MIIKAFTKVAIFFVYLISLLPFWVLYLFSDAVFILLFYVTHYRRKVAQENLRNAFPEKSQTERAQIERKYYRYLADLLVESVKLFSISSADLQKHIQMIDAELLNKYFADKRSVIGAVGHYGNWEMALLGLSLCIENQKLIVYKPVKNNQIEAVIKRSREKFGAQLIPMKATMRTLINKQQEQIITILASDQTPVREETQYFANFLNQPTAVFLGVEKMAKLTNSAVVFCDIRLVKRGYYTCTFVPLIKDPKPTAEHEITNTHVQYLEKVIREEPAYWLWSHRRWKFKPEDIHK
ncbi:MAG: lysophospholipid acyltransferase family protein [Janthinobacterium lividum]